MSNKEEPKETTNKVEKKPITKKIIIIAIVVILLALSPFGVKWFTESKQNDVAKIETLEKELKVLEKKQDQEFDNFAFSGNYYTLAEEIAEKHLEIEAAKASLTIKYTIVPIIAGCVLLFILILVFAISAMVSGFNKIDEQAAKTRKARQAERVKMGRHKIVLDVIDRRNNEDVKLKPLKCPSCNASVEHDAKKCEYCGTSLIKVKK